MIHIGNTFNCCNFMLISLCFVIRELYMSCNEQGLFNCGSILLFVFVRFVLCSCMHLLLLLLLLLLCVHMCICMFVWVCGHMQCRHVQIQLFATCLVIASAHLLIVTLHVFETVQSLKFLLY